MRRLQRKKGRPGGDLHSVFIKSVYTDALGEWIPDEYAHQVLCGHFGRLIRGLTRACKTF